MYHPSSRKQNKVIIYLQCRSCDHGNKEQHCHWGNLMLNAVLCRNRQWGSCLDPDAPRPPRCPAAPLWPWRGVTSRRCEQTKNAAKSPPTSQTHKNATPNVVWCPRNCEIFHNCGRGLYCSLLFVVLLNLLSINPSIIKLCLSIINFLDKCPNFAKFLWQLYQAHS